MKRIVALLGLTVLPVLGFTPAAHAVGYGACTISGSITFSAGGEWRIPHAIIDCQGVIGAGEERIIGPGPFKGSGSFTALAPGEGGCLQQGTGKVDYEMLLSGGRAKVSEPVDHTLMGAAGVLNTPTLHGPLQLPPPYDGDCVTTPLGETTFVAQVVLYRYPREVPVPLPGV